MCGISCPCTLNSYLIDNGRLVNAYFNCPDKTKKIDIYLTWIGMPRIGHRWVRRARPAWHYLPHHRSLAFRTIIRTSLQFRCSKQAIWSPGKGILRNRSDALKGKNYSSDLNMDFLDSFHFPGALHIAFSLVRFRACYRWHYLHRL